MAFLADWWWSSVIAWLTVFWVCSILFGLERLFPHGAQPTNRTLFRSVIMQAAYAPAAALAVQVDGRLVAALHLRPLVLLPVGRWFSGDLHWLGLIIGPILFLLIWDFFYYWCHRAQHAWPWLWRFHSLHHSVRELSAATSVAHWSERFVRLALISLPMAALLNVGVRGQAVAATVFIAMQGYYAHSPTRLNFGPVVRWILADNRSHRIHHSVEPRHFDRNFGAATMIWDHLFRTAYRPGPAEWPETGLADQAPPASIGQFLGWSFGRRLGDPVEADLRARDPIA